MIYKRIPFYILIALLCLALTSCVRHHQLVNFRKQDEASLNNYRKNIDLPVLYIQPDDILYITVNSPNDLASQPYNLTQGQGSNMAAGQSMMLMLQGYAVDSTGNIDFPNIGQLKVGGMSLEGARNVVAEALRPYLSNIAVNVKFLNFRYSIIGDVVRPGTYTTINERVSLLEALASAGDMTPYAARQRVSIIREIDGVRTIAELDLQSDEFFASPYYYIRQNDVIYVEPIQAKVATVADPVTRLISYGTALISVITAIVLLAR